MIRKDRRALYPYLPGLVSRHPWTSKAGLVPTPAPYTDITDEGQHTIKQLLRSQEGQCAWLITPLQWFSTWGSWTLWGQISGVDIRYPAYQIFTLWLITAKLQLWSGNRKKHFMAGGHHMRNYIKRLALGKLGTTVELKMPCNLKFKNYFQDFPLNIFTGWWHPPLIPALRGRGKQIAWSTECIPG